VLIKPHLFLSLFQVLKDQHGVEACACVRLDVIPYIHFTINFISLPVFTTRSEFFCEWLAKFLYVLLEFWMACDVYLNALEDEDFLLNQMMNRRDRSHS